MPRVKLLLEAWIGRLYEDEELTKQGHLQRVEDLNLGLGWLYYALARALRPANVVVIGSKAGFTPLVFGRALQDNLEGGAVTFVDPSFVDDFWADPQRVRRHFESYGVGNVRHFRLTTEQFAETREYEALGDVGILFVDGHHTEEAARFDHETFVPKLSPDAVVLFHDSTEEKLSKIYRDAPYLRTVVRYVEALKRDPSLQVLDLPLGGGLTLVRRVLEPGLDGLGHG
jgi:predicted O-methyltransferase YrrM